MAKKLYVGGIPYSTTNEGLKAHFEQAGAVDEAMIIMDRMTNRSKGFGFVTMSSDKDGQKAVDMFHGKPLEGRNLTVNEARPMEPREKRM